MQETNRFVFVLFKNNNYFQNLENTENSVICASCHLKCSCDSYNFEDHIIETDQNDKSSDWYILVPLTVKLENDEHINKLCCALDIKKPISPTNENGLLETLILEKNEIILDDVNDELQEG